MRTLEVQKRDYGLHVIRSRITAIMTLLISILTLFSCSAGIWVESIYGDLKSIGRLSKLLHFGSIAQDIIFIPLALILASLSVAFLVRPGYKLMIVILGLTGNEQVDNLIVQATFTNGKNKVSAMLYFNEEGQLVNFISEDRYRGYENATWSTPVTVYKRFGDLNLSAKASAMWHFPDREYSYAEFDVQKVEYNVSVLK